MALSSKIDKALVDAIRLAKSITVLTGAGMSAESGIPTFREAQTGLWEKYDPQELATPEAFEKNPKLVWDWYEWRRNMLSSTRPHAGHFALVEMAKLIPEFHLITQNVDKMHQRSGYDDVIELHGDLFSARYTKTGEKASLDFFDIYDDYIEFWDDFQKYPLTTIRPNIVWFGEELLSEELSMARQYSESCDVFIVAGTSGQVYPAAALPQLAKDNAALVIEVNPEETSLTEIADYSFRGPVSQWLPAIIDAVWAVSIDIDDASKYSCPDNKKYSKEVLNVIARYMSLPEIKGVGLFPSVDRSIVNIFMDEAAHRKNGTGGRNKEHFRMCVFGNDGYSWYSGISYAQEGMRCEDLYVIASDSFSELDKSFQNYANKITIVVGDGIKEENLSDLIDWQKGNGYWVGNRKVAPTKEAV